MPKFIRWQEMHDLHSLMQILTEELVKEVENSIAEFKQHNQEYDEERVKAQVTLVSVSISIILYKQCISCFISPVQIVERKKHMLLVH